MKKIKLFWTPFASRCLDEIKSYIKRETQSEIIANKQISRLIERAEQLTQFPESGQQEELLKNLKQNSRYLLYYDYKIIYQYHHDNKIIITDVFHVKQNPVKISRNSND